MLRLLTYRIQRTNDWNFKNLINTNDSILLKQEVEDFERIAVVFGACGMLGKPPHIGKQHR